MRMGTVRLGVWALDQGPIFLRKDKSLSHEGSQDLSIFKFSQGKGHILRWERPCG